MNNAQQLGIKTFKDIPAGLNSSIKKDIYKELGEFCYIHESLWGKEYVACVNADSKLCSREEK